MSEANSKTRGFGLPVMQGLLPIKGSQVPAEIIAGITLAALAIPEVMGYTKIAGTPVITGLYTMLIPTMLFAIFGSSRHLVVGADSATAAILAAGLVGIPAVLQVQNSIPGWSSRTLAPWADQIQRVVVLAPSHRIPFAGIAASSADSRTMINTASTAGLPP